MANSPRIFQPLFYLAAVLACWLPAVSVADPWLLIDVRARTVSVIDRGEIVIQYEDISLGRGGVTLMREQGDGKTPLGRFQVAWINSQSRFKLFFGLDYPNLDYARRAYNANLIGEDDYRAIDTAFRNNVTPPQTTRLGGFIGIHGLGESDPRVHKGFNWTDGCIALTNQQILDLSHWVSVGTKVIIQ